MGTSLVDGDVDDVARLEGDVELGIALDEEAVDRRCGWRCSSPAGELADDDDLLARVPGQAARLRKSTGQDRLTAEELERAGPLDGPDDGDAAAQVFEDVAR